MLKKVVILKKILNKFFAIAHGDMISFLEDDDVDEMIKQCLALRENIIYQVDMYDETDEMQYDIQLVVVYELDEVFTLIDLNIFDCRDEYDTICDDDDDEVLSEIEALEID